MYKTLIYCELFKGISEIELSELLKSVSHQLKKYSKDQILSSAGNEVRGLYILLSGSMRAEMTDMSGKTIKIEEIDSPRALAPAFIFGNENKFPVDIIANNNVELIFFYRDDFLKLLQLNQTILMNYLNVISNRTHFLTAKIKFLSFQTIKGKFANYLLSISKKLNSDEFVLPITQTKLASLFGVTRPALAKAIRELNMDEIITTDGKNIIIQDKPKLAGLIKSS